MRHMSRVTSQVSCVKSQILFTFLLNGGASGEGLLSTGPTLSSLFKTSLIDKSLSLHIYKKNHII